MEQSTGTYTETMPSTSSSATGAEALSEYLRLRSTPVEADEQVVQSKMYYECSTELYMRVWGESFHFAPILNPTEPFSLSIARMQHAISMAAGLKPGMHAFDLGCGIGGPMREIARFSGANITGINNSPFQVDIARGLNHKYGLSYQCKIEERDWMKLPAEDNSMDGAYAIEATCHCRDRAGLFAEVYRVLKPGAKFAVVDWLATDSYDPMNPEHVKCLRGIEDGNALNPITTVPEIIREFESAGFKVISTEDKAKYTAGVPWHHVLAGRYWRTNWSCMHNNFISVHRTKLGAQLSCYIMEALSKVGIAPKGIMDASKMLHKGADALVQGGDLGIFTPSMLITVQK